jgi:hypothetical protein
MLHSKKVKSISGERQMYWNKEAEETLEKVAGN